MIISKPEMMSKKIIGILFILPALGFVSILQAQVISRSNIASAGGVLSNGTNSISFSIGGPVSSSLSSGSNMITQGFQQPGEELHTGNISSPLCAGTVIQVPYTAIDIGGVNTFTAQLSDAAGSFTAATDIGSITGNESGNISAVIPTTVTSGTAYRIRVVSSYPPLNGTDNNSNIIVHSVVPVTVNAIVNNSCHGGNSGSITAAAVGTPVSGYSFAIAGPTVNTTGASSGVFTGLTAGNYTITLTTTDGCAFMASTTALVTEPAGILPDISLGSDISSNFYAGVNSENDIVYNVSEIAGNAATGDTVRIIRITGYSFVFDPAATAISIGGTDYALDNSHWKLDDSNPLYVSLILDPLHNNMAGTLDCSNRVYVAIKLKRNSPNRSTFGLTARLRRSNGELNLQNNLNTIVFTAE